MDVAPDVLRVLRALDDTLDVYTLPDGRVWLLEQSGKWSRIQAGRSELYQARLEGFDEPMYAASLMAEGFEQLGEYPYWLGTSAGFLLQQATAKLYATARQIEARLRELKANSDGTAHKLRARATMRERVVLGAQSDYAWAFRGRRSISNVR